MCTPPPCSKITSVCQMSAFRQLCIPYSTSFLTAQVSRCAMDYGGASEHFNASMWEVFESGPNANISHTSAGNKHTELCCSHAVQCTKWPISSWRETHTFSITVQAFLNPLYLQSIIAFLCGFMCLGRHFFHYIALNLEILCNTPHIIPLSEVKRNSLKWKIRISLFRSFSQLFTFSFHTDKPTAACLISCMSYWGFPLKISTLLV